MLVGRKAQFKNLVDKAFIDWGKDARAIVRVQWLRKYGGGVGMFLVSTWKMGISSILIRKAIRSEILTIH